MAYNYSPWWRASKGLQQEIKESVEAVEEPLLTPEQTQQRVAAENASFWATIKDSSELAFDGKNVIDRKKFLGVPPKEELGGINKMEFSQDVETGKQVTTFSADDNMEVHGDLDVSGDLCVDGNLRVKGQIKASYSSIKQAASQELDDDEVFLTPQELTVIQLGLDQLQYDRLSGSLGISIKAAQKLVQVLYEKLID